MTLRAKSRLLSALLFLALCAIMYVVLRFTVVSLLLDDERARMLVHLEVAQAMLDEQLSQLTSTAGDWAFWDETYAFVEGLNADYVRANLDKDTLANLRVHVIAFVNNAGQVVHLQAFDAGFTRETPPPKGLLEQLQAGKPLVSHRLPTSSARGLVGTEEGLLMVASLPILTGARGGPIRGALIMGRRLTAADIVRIGRVSAAKLSVIPMGPKPLPEVPAKALAQLEAGQSQCVMPLGAGAIAGFALLRDVYGKPLALLEAERPRLFFLRGQADVRLILLALFAGALVLAILGLAVQERLVLSPLALLSREVEAIGRSGELSRRVPYGGGHELGRLGSAINLMLHDLEHAQRLREAGYERYERLVELAQEGIVAVDEEERITFVNPALAAALGYEAGELLGRSMLTLADASSPGATHRKTEKQQSGRTSNYELVLRAKDGSRRDFLCAESPMFDAAGRPEGTLQVLTDITERKRTEQALAYGQKMESLALLTGGIAHDFNNLLVGIMGNAGLAIQELAPASLARKPVEDILRASQRAAELTRQMLAYSGRGQFIIEPLDLSALVSEMAQLLSAAIPKNVVLEYHLADDLPSVEGDAVQIRQVVMNLLLNAAESVGKQSGTVRLATGTVHADRDYLRAAFVDDELAVGDYVFLEVTDTGCGMDKETIARIFDPFFTTKFAGRGLGLAAVLGVVRAHRGSIHVYSEVGSGATFKVLLPVSTRAPQPRAEVAEAPDWRGEGTVLVIDDEPAVRIVAKRTLEQRGFTVLLGTDGVKGVALFRAHLGEVALVLLDMTMPRMSGAETYEQLRAISTEVPVILSSGYSEQDAVARFGASGLAGFLQKPYAPVDLSAKVREVLAIETAKGGAEG
jgi:PAS domain S-box-containing protein